MGNNLYKFKLLSATKLKTNITIKSNYDLLV